MLGDSSMSILKVDTINEKTSGNGVTIPGHVIQVKQTLVKDSFSTAIGGGFAEMTDFRTTITPSSTNSKILIRGDLFVGAHYYQIKGRILRNTTPIDDALGNQQGNRTRTMWNIINYSGGTSNSQYELSSASFSYLDSPATTSEITYSLDMGGYSTSYTVYLNRQHAYTNGTANDSTPMSSFTLMEIAG